MSTTCPQCGATYPNSTSCQEIFETFLALEFSDPAYGAVHFFTVSCFMIQHGRYSDSALKWIRQQLRDTIELDASPAEIRMRATGQLAPKILRQPQDPPQPLVQWSMTIVDVAASYHDAPSYCHQIGAWARKTLAEMDVISPSS